MAQLNCGMWEKMLLRWCPMEPTPEVRLVCWVLLHWIADEPAFCRGTDRALYETGVFDGVFQAYARMVQLNPEFIVDQVRVANRAQVSMPAKQASGGWKHHHQVAA